MFSLVSLSEGESYKLLPHPRLSLYWTETQASARPGALSGAYYACAVAAAK